MRKHDQYVFTRYQGIKKFWTEREYQYQNLIINGFIVQRELPGANNKKRSLRARIDIYYDNNGKVGIKKINGNEKEVFNAACKYLSPGERDELNKKWIKAKYLGNYDHNDPECKKDLNSPDLAKEAPWIKVEDDHAIENINWTPNPLKDLFLTKDIDQKDVVGEKGLSTLYKHIKGDLELTKKKALEYARTIGVGAATLMFDPLQIPVWGNVNFTEDFIKKDEIRIPTNDPEGSETLIPTLYDPGRVFIPDKFETAICPAELYRVDIKAIKVKSKDSIYDGFIAYYYETDKVDANANNKLCLIRHKNKKENWIDEAFGDYKYFLGIFQIYGTKNRVLNPDPTSDQKIIAENIEPDLVAPIISFTKAKTLEADKIISNNIKDTQQLGRLIREENHNRMKLARQKQLILSATDKVDRARKDTDKNLYKSEKLLKSLAVKQKELDIKLQSFLTKIYYEEQKKEAEKKRFTNYIFGARKEDDDMKIPPLFLKKDEKKIA